MSIRKLTYTVLGVLALLSIGNAQKYSWFDVEAGWTIHRVQDMGHSPLLYEGQSLFYGVSFNRQTARFFSSIHVSLAGSDLKPSLEDQVDYGLNSARRSSVYGHYSLLVKRPINNLSIAYGGTFAVFYDFITFNHSANNLVGYELSLSLNPTLLADYRVSEKLKFTFMGSIPLVGYGTRPDALGLFPLSDFEVDMGEILGGGSFFSVNKVFSLQTRISTEFKLRQKSVSLFYDYFGGVNRVLERKGFSFHKIGIQIPLKINWK